MMSNIRRVTDSVIRGQDSFVTDSSKKFGLSETVIREERQLYRDIKPEVQEFIKENDIGKSEALLIAREEDKVQEKIVERLLENPAKKIESIIKTLTKELIVSKIKNEEKNSSDLEILTSLKLSPKIYNIWSFSNCIEGIGKEYPGRMAGQIALNLLYYFTKQKDLVVDLMAGGGTIHDSCKFMNRDCISFDLVPSRDFIIEKDILNDFPNKEIKQAKLIFFDPPYWKQKRGDYSLHENNLANHNLKEFYFAIEEIIKQSATTMSEGSYFVFIHNNTTYIDKQFHVFEFMKIAEKYLTLVEWISVPYSTQQIQPQQVIKAKEEKKLLDISRYLVIYQKAGGK